MLRHTLDDKDQIDAAVQYSAARAPTLSRNLKHNRQRSSSCSATFYSSTIVPASFSNEALSSLISSLSSISDSQKSRTTSNIREDENPSDAIDHLTANPNFHRQLHVQPSIKDANEQDYCPPPVAGYNTINAAKPPPRPKTSDNDTRSARRSEKKSQPYLHSSKSQTNIRSEPPQQDLHSPGSIPPLPPPCKSYNESIVSVSSSTNSKLSRCKSPFKMFFSSRLGNEHNRSEGQISPESIHEQMSPDDTALSEKEHRFSAFVTVSKLKTNFETKEADRKTLSSTSPSARNDLDENLIPSRRSSLRSGPRRSSRGSRDLKSLNIDQDLIEENNETVQRIRELQQAREKRHSEWRREARRSEKAAKRTSLLSSSNSSPAERDGSIRGSWHPKFVESPQEEKEPELSARMDASGLATMPAFIDMADDRPLTPIERSIPSGEDFMLKRNLSVTTSTTQSINSAKKHKKRLSDSLRRASSIRGQPLPEDAKGVIDEVEAFLGSPRFTQKIRHPRTGRTIAFSEVGDPDGFVVFCCVGMGLTRYVTSFYDEVAKTQKLRIITPDRPGVGETEAMQTERTTPLAWVDDVAVICSSLGIEKFSLLAHSAGAIYALATALKMPQYVRGRIHLLAPWIPPSQLSASGYSGEVKAANLPISHKILSFLPTSFMKAANSRFFNVTSASLEPKTRKDRKKDCLSAADLALDAELFGEGASLSAAEFENGGSMLPTPETSPKNNQPTNNMSCYQAEQVRSPPMSPTPGASPMPPRSHTMSPSLSAGTCTPPPSRLNFLTPQARQKLYNTTLTHRTWTLATLDANPAVDLIICLERRRPIGFRYTDITRTVIIHHGGMDTRVPLDNVRWLSMAMKRCELRVLENEGHGLMASAGVMSSILTEIGKEWEEWSHIAAAREKERKREEEEEERARKEQEEQLREKTARARRGYPRW